MANGRKWTGEDTATLRRMVRAGYTDAEIGRHTGHAAVTVFYRRQTLGLEACSRIERAKRLTFVAALAIPTARRNRGRGRQAALIAQALLG